LHFYHLAALDYIDTTGILERAPWKPRYTTPDMLKGAAATSLVNNYVLALTMRRKAHQMGAIFGGRMPAPPVFVPSGCTSSVTTDKITAFRALLTELTTFINSVYLADVQTLAGAFPAYKTIGRGCGNLLAYGVFDLDAAGSSKLLRRGRYTDGQYASVDPAQIIEYVKSSYYATANGNLNPAVGTTTPVVDKAGAYSWIKAPRYRQGVNGSAVQKVHEVGPLARMWVNGDYRTGISVMDRLMARALETKKVALAMAGWLNLLKSGQPSMTRSVTIPATGSGIGLTEAPRGALGHWMSLSSSKIGNYQIVTPTAWNASPLDDFNQHGAIEQALIGTPIADPAQPIELMRVVHSFDPCLACSVHLLQPNGKVHRITAEG
jgi:hydrogenase large subunit